MRPLAVCPWKTELAAIEDTPKAEVIERTFVVELRRSVSTRNGILLLARDDSVEFARSKQMSF